VGHSALFGREHEIVIMSACLGDSDNCMDYPEVEHAAYACLYVDSENNSAPLSYWVDSVNNVLTLSYWVC